LIKACCERLA